MLKYETANATDVAVTVDGSFYTMHKVTVNGIEDFSDSPEFTCTAVPTSHTYTITVNAFGQTSKSITVNQAPPKALAR